MVRPMCSAGAIGLAVLTALLSLAGCTDDGRGGYDNGGYGDSQYRPRPYGYYQPQELYPYRRHEFRSDGNYCYYHGCDSRDMY